jgi:hypothetical protein
MTEGLVTTQSNPVNVLLSRGDLIAIAAIVIGFVLTVIMFRVQRELYMRDKGEPNWVPWADWLIIVSLFLVLSLTVIPLFFFSYLTLASPA